MGRYKKTHLRQRLCRITYRNKCVQTFFRRLHTSMEEVCRTLNPRC